MLMNRLFDGIIQSIMGKRTGVDITWTFDSEGHFQGHKVK